MWHEKDRSAAAVAVDLLAMFPLTYSSDTDRLFQSMRGRPFIIVLYQSLIIRVIRTILLHFCFEQYFFFHRTFFY